MSLDYLKQFKSEENIAYLASIVSGTTLQGLQLFLTTYADFEPLPLWPGVRKLNREYLQRNIKKFAPTVEAAAPVLPLQQPSYQEQMFFSEVTHLPSEWDARSPAAPQQRLMRREGIPFYQHLSRGPTATAHFTDFPGSA
jgi:hypothetical protein